MKLLKSTSNQIMLLSLALWFVSLALTGYVTNSGVKSPGYGILVMGWLSPIIFNFAWYANLFYLWGVITILRGARAVFSPMIAILLSMDMFRYSSHLNNEGGSTTPLYGFGWGAWIWLIAIFLLLSAAGFRESEIKDKKRAKLPARTFQYLGIFLVCMTFASVMYYAITDRSKANASELEKLSRVAFKIGEVCTVADPEVLQPMGNVSWPLEIETDTGSKRKIDYLRRTKELLHWGVPVVRVNQRDYYLRPEDPKEIISAPASDSSPASIGFFTFEDGSQRIRLTDHISSRVVVDFTWKRQRYSTNDYIYCPDYSSTPFPDSQPRRLLIEALGLTDNPFNQKNQAWQKHQRPNIFKARVVNLSSEIYATETIEERKARLSIEPTNEFHTSFNYICPGDTGWDGSDSSVTSIGWPFIIGDTRYYPNRRSPYNATCTRNAIYLTSGFSRKDKYILNLQKRDLTDFRKVWTEIIHITGLPKAGSNGFYVVAVNERNETLNILLKQKKGGEHFNVLANRLDLVD